eukprot:CAMPEP_0197823972 /NCGR_PEP_ID=MMETSP1437-20131217/1286_1 /TAXON_ID=49252 ORGANISM="Eucampia antarctica, Strain CCMP1452" /NCGR_SAMPLE_ID=MMETSP1437 /ASSEMBLY_ACC=CAM_ASM_001096 /LENGTH=388 /DNA_ID=CAMNT_0043423413 /DNA_START=95 /DNA_END=1261 /DNA_ORIENTATION=+
MGAQLSSLDWVYGASGIIGALLLGAEVLTPSNPISNSWRLFRQMWGHNARLSCNDNVSAGIDNYNELHKSEDAAERNSNYAELVNSYYDLATVFYEWGWGSSFHFAHQLPHESFDESIRRHEYQLAACLGPSPKRVLDVGCGIGGPLRNITRFLPDSDITGITLNPYQVERGNQLCNLQGLQDRCRVVQGDFMKLPFEPQSFDAAYAIEATCHAPDRVGVYSQILNSLKPGSIFACYEWCMTDKYDPTNPAHIQAKKWIEEGDGLPNICSTKDCLQAMKDAGFIILKETDLCNVYQGEGTAWNTPLLPSWNPLTQRFQFCWLGRRITTVMLRTMEFLRLAPQGSFKTQQMLQRGGDGLGIGGQLDIFTPMYLMVGQVPLNTATASQKQ